MRRDDERRFAALILCCAEVYNRKLTKEVVEVYWRILRDRDLAEIEAALDAHLKYCRFMPSPSEILGRIRGGTSEERAVLSWPKVAHTLELRMTDETTLIPDGAACRAASAMVEARIGPDQLKWSQEYFKLKYREFYEQGLSESPAVFEGPRTGDPYYAEYPPRRVLLKIWWPPEAIKAHAAALSRFDYDYRILLGLEDDRPALPQPEGPGRIEREGGR